MVLRAHSSPLLPFHAVCRQLKLVAPFRWCHCSRVTASLNENHLPIAYQLLLYLSCAILSLCTCNVAPPFRIRMPTLAYVNLRAPLRAQTSIVISGRSIAHPLSRFVPSSSPLFLDESFHFDYATRPKGTGSDNTFLFFSAISS